MANLHFVQHINAPREKVWDSMISDKTYREWAGSFAPGSYFVGDWKLDSRMQFLGPSEGKADGGMIALVKENIPNAYISLKYLAELQDGVEVPWGGGCYENYTFKDSGTGTDVEIDVVNLGEEYVDMFKETWPKALEKLKEIAER